MTRWVWLALLPWVYGAAPSDPGWRASDRLDARRGVPQAGTVWVRAGLTTWEALPGFLSSGIAVGREPSSGAGARVAWRSLTWPDGSMNDLEGAFIWRRTGWRAECAVRQMRMVGERALQCSPRFLIAVSPHLLAGGSITFFPEGPGGAPEFEVEARSAVGPWFLGLVLHEDASEAAVGIDARPGLTVMLRYANDVPAFGIVLDAHAVELRAEAEDHPQLGRVARVAVRWMRGRS